MIIMTVVVVMNDNYVGCDDDCGNDDGDYVDD